MKTHVEQYVWNLLEDLGVDLENNNEASEKCNECIENIINKYDKYINQKGRVICDFCNNLDFENIVKLCSSCQSENNI